MLTVEELTAQLDQAVRMQQLLHARIRVVEESRDRAWKVAGENLCEAEVLRHKLDTAIAAQVAADEEVAYAHNCVQLDVQTAVAGEVEVWRANSGEWRWGIPLDCRVEVLIEDIADIPVAIEGVANSTYHGDERADVEFVATLNAIGREPTGTWCARYSVKEVGE
jgi:hypothetical protein